MRNAAGTVLNTLTTASLPIDSSVVTLNFPLTPGTSYRLTQPASPSLKRNTTGVTYPYTTAGLVSVTNGWTGTTTSSTAYYYYYDWKIQSPNVTCTSVPRVPVVATITTATGISALSTNNGVAIYPNPAKNNLTIQSSDLIKNWNLYNLFGEKLLSGIGNSINTLDLENGIYILKIKTNQFEFIKKVSIQK